MVELVQLIDSETKVKVSSTLEKSVGKRYLTDGNPETCWTSQQGTPQYIQLTFSAPAIPQQVQVTFQGGFVGTSCTVEIAQGIDKPEWKPWTKIYPEDVNRKQIFDLPSERLPDADGVQNMKLVFEESSDFFGRITVYDLQLVGKKLT
ncbi:hypothetical protein PHLGIDRAFT_125051 [Phlebiopsis gigantea 11061_1 CR5-6]|uniref:F5/8 type C domain-containing protein n=1 Tax=Phlebiopsis gigantea (strain 11061_1 CR5-6) TaxID=745531 RepID=A0A0C3S5A5_PHLG1|nr:hypothetical protein PHLGIDRAFT_125051 [Phlebiopsis gigantea 11061_1 CR5-6]